MATNNFNKLSLDSKSKDSEINAVYNPRPDITTYELAILLVYVTGQQKLTVRELEVAERLCPNISRHLIMKDNDDTQV